MSRQPTLRVRRLWGAFTQGLRDLGYVEGQNIAIEHRSSDGKFERLSDLAADLVRLKVDVIVAPASQNVLAAKQATRTIPIVMANSLDPAGMEPDFAEAGNLMQYGPDRAESCHRAAYFVDKTLKGLQAGRSPRGAADQV